MTCLFGFHNWTGHYVWNGKLLVEHCTRCGKARVR
jgi:hypothetical protein